VSKTIAKLPLTNYKNQQSS